MMMKIKLFLLIALSVVISVAKGQNMVSSGGAGVLFLKPMGSSIPTGLKRGSFVGPHLLGDTITYKLNILEKSYVYFKPTSGAYAVEEKVVLKRNIYKKVKEFDDFITKSYVKGLVTREDAQQRLSNIVDIGIKLMNFDTKQLEKDVRKVSTPVDFERLMNELKFR